ncbi:hypothetical protein GH808_09065 [Acetobacterium fimetarium]|uniref:DUF2283 domain-containing protein n=1 Tax=Acetobacterium fimetarium TaxID=52691 RepID=A0ABR6WVC5_9FIRM|nr:hypothetical protein [Acetobacterium fimetarium]MBC3804579.1 hypothetical protein [Acetobacterium fimetarium]
MLKPVKYIELKNGQLMQQPDLEIDIDIPLEDETIRGFLLVKYSGRRLYMNKDQIASIEVIEQVKKPRYSFD